MKKAEHKKRFRSQSLFLLTLLAVHLTFTFDLHSQVRVESTGKTDSISPVSLSVAAGTLSKFETGVSYELTKDLTIGIHGALLPKGIVFGIHSKAEVGRIGNECRVFIATPLEFYPSATNALGSGGSLVLWPVVEGHWRLKNIEVSAGVGVVCAAWLETIEVPVMSLFGPADGLKQERKVPEAYVRNSLQAGITMPIHSLVSLGVQAGLILSGLSVEDQNWIGGPPILFKVTLTGNI